MTFYNISSYQYKITSLPFVKGLQEYDISMSSSNEKSVAN